MRSFKVSLTQRDAAANPLPLGAGSAQVEFGMRFVKLLPGNMSLFRFRILPSGGPSPLDFYLDSTNAAELFSCFNDVFWGEPIESTQLETVDSASNPVGTLELSVGISPAFPPITFPDYPNVVKICTLSLTPSGGPPTNIMVANSDTSALEWYMDAMLMSNPPNPPR